MPGDDYECLKYLWMSGADYEWKPAYAITLNIKSAEKFCPKIENI